MFSALIATPSSSTWAEETVMRLLEAGADKPVLVLCASWSIAKELRVALKITNATNFIEFQTIRGFFEKQFPFLRQGFDSARRSGSSIISFGRFYSDYLDGREEILSGINFEEACKVMLDKESDEYDWLKANTLYKELCLLAPHGVYHDKIDAEKSQFKLNEFPEIKEKIKAVLENYRLWMRENNVLDPALSKLSHSVIASNEKLYSSIIFNRNEALPPNMKAYLLALSNKLITPTDEKTKSQLKREKEKKKAEALKEMQEKARALIDRILTDDSDDQIVLAENEVDMLNQISFIDILLSTKEGCDVLSVIVIDNPHIAISVLENLQESVVKKEMLSKRVLLNFIVFLAKSTEMPRTFSVHFYISQNITQVFNKLLDIFIQLEGHDSELLEKIRPFIIKLMHEKPVSSDIFLNTLSLPHTLCLPYNHVIFLKLINAKVFSRLGDVWSLVKNGNWRIKENEFSLLLNLLQTSEGITILHRFSSSTLMLDFFSRKIKPFLIACCRKSLESECPAQLVYFLETAEGISLLNDFIKTEDVNQPNELAELVSKKIIAFLYQEEVASQYAFVRKASQAQAYLAIGFLIKYVNIERDSFLIEKLLGALSGLYEVYAEKMQAHAGNSIFLQDFCGILDNLSDMQEKLSLKVDFDDLRKMLFSTALHITEKYIEKEKTSYTAFRKIIRIFEYTKIDNIDDLNKVFFLFEKMHSVHLMNIPYSKIKVLDQCIIDEVIDGILEIYRSFMYVCADVNKARDVFKMVITVYKLAEENFAQYSCRENIECQNTYAAAYAAIWLALHNEVQLEKENNPPCFTRILDEAISFISQNPLKESWSEQSKNGVYTFYYLFLSNFPGASSVPSLDASGMHVPIFHAQLIKKLADVRERMSILSQATVLVIPLGGSASFFERENSSEPAGVARGILSSSRLKLSISSLSGNPPVKFPMY